MVCFKHLTVRRGELEILLQVTAPTTWLLSPPTSDHGMAQPFYTHLVHSPSSFSLSYIVCWNAIYLYHWQKFTYQLPTCYGMELGCRTLLLLISEMLRPYILWVAAWPPLYFLTRSCVQCMRVMFPIYPRWYAAPPPSSTQPRQC